MFNKGPKTIYGNIKVKRKSKSSLPVLIIIVVVIVTTGWFILNHIYRSSYTVLSPVLYYAEKPVRVVETAGMISKGDQVQTGRTIMIPVDCERNIFIAGSSISVRAGNGARFKFKDVVAEKKTDIISVEIELLSGNLWITREDNKDTVKVTTPKGYLTLNGSAEAELRVTGSGSVEVICWNGDAAFYPSKDSKENVGLAPKRQTVVTQAGSIAAPYDVRPEEINLWEAWNMLTGMKQVLSGKILSYKQAFIEFRKKNKISGELPEKVILSSATLISGGNQRSDWQKAGISPDGKIIISYREDGVQKDEKGLLNIRLTFRNDGTVKAEPLIVAVEAIDASGKVAGRKEVKLPALPPLNETQIDASMNAGADVMSYNVRVLF
ncbi:MAG: hypothetical protein LWY06_18015 [Firmicutes bacterium]|nr:hypothetical protein [Bacillota bacterium]